MRILEFFAGIFAAIGSFFVMIGKGILFGILAVFKGIWWVLKTTGILIYRVVAYVVGLIVRYFFVYLPALIMVIYALLLIFNVIQNLDTEIHGLWDYVSYGYNLTNALANWLTSVEHNFFTAITLGLFQVILIAVVAVLETLIIYVLFFGVGSLIWMGIQFILWMVFLVVLPAAAVVYSISNLIKNSKRYNSWFYILVTLITLACAVYYFMLVIPAFGSGF